MIKPSYSSGTEKAEIEIREADDLYREIRVDNQLTDDKGEKTSLKEGADRECRHRSRVRRYDEETRMNLSAPLRSA